MTKFTEEEIAEMDASTEAWNNPYVNDTVYETRPKFNKYIFADSLLDFSRSLDNDKCRKVIRTLTEARIVAQLYDDHRTLYALLSKAVNALMQINSVQAIKLARLVYEHTGKCLDHGVKTFEDVTGGMRMVDGEPEDCSKESTLCGICWEAV